MVDWKELGKKALDATKEVTENSVDSFREWKDDPNRIAKVEEKKAEKSKSKALKKNFDSFSSTGIIQESTYKVFKRNKITKIIQERPNEIIIKQGRKKEKLQLEKAEFSDKQNSTGGALIGAVLGGPTGAIIGGTTKSSRVFANLYVRTLDRKKTPHVIRFTADQKEAAQLLRLQITED
ncbi:hypothetical protein [Enterococcus dongliensis]|uniref:Uncharacterized protein n=1 Tax=Enterococcus dongliensis TaxID=2559925 RepID=A0ABU3ERY6_9ENTE|nr:hypothetical protein [Enterococcus dongliensis]MDT2597093.1 hypothetical protein [Enterococcus dongliensis]MDT2648119.1 hypothetical protein [Enterococcus dongliensis]